MFIEDFCKSFLTSLFFIKYSILLLNSSTFNVLKVIEFVVVSGRPPLFDIITAHPFAEASKLVLPKGSSHLEHTTAIEVSLKISNTLL